MRQRTFDNPAKRHRSLAIRSIYRISRNTVKLCKWHGMGSTPFQWYLSILHLKSTNPRLESTPVTADCPHPHPSLIPSLLHPAKNTHAQPPVINHRASLSISPSIHPSMRARNVRANSPSATPSFPAYACIYLLLPPFTCSRNPRFARDSVPIRTLLPLPSLFRTTTTSKVQCGENILNDSIDFTHPNHIM